MAINDYKNIEKINLELESTAQIINPTDLNIFKTAAKNVADFGMSKNDVIEFRLYDISNNILEQTGGRKVRYIKNTELPNYLRSSLDTQTGEKIFEIDVEKLVLEAGYSNGEFRVAFTFLKNYVGNDQAKSKVWIHEISPSRTEIRVLPLFGNDDVINKDLQDRYDAAIENGAEYREVYPRIEKELDRIEPQIATIIDNYFISKFGQQYIDILNRDFIFGGIQGYTNFKTKVYTDFRTSILNELSGKAFDIFAANYGRPISTGVDLDSFLTQSKLRTLIGNRLSDSIEYNFSRIPKRDATPQIVRAV